MHRRANRPGMGPSFTSFNAEGNANEEREANGRLHHSSISIGHGDSIAPMNNQRREQQQRRRRRRKRRQVLQLNPFSSLYQNMEEDRELVVLVWITGLVLFCTALALAFLFYFKKTQRPNTSWLAYSHFFFNQISKLMPHFIHFPMLGDQLFGKAGQGYATPSNIYTIPNSLPNIGDKSDEYAILRKEYDDRFPLDNPERSLSAVQNAQWKPERTTKASNTQSKIPTPPPYDIYNCPDEPRPGYPHDWHTLDILEFWPPDIVQPPQSESGTGVDDVKLDYYQGICVFDYYNDYTKILKYRKAEVPYVVRGDPQVAQAVERWNTPGYMSKLLTDHIKHRAEFAQTNSFLYWLPPKRKTEPRDGGDQRSRPGSEPPPGWKQPTKHMQMTFDEWVTHANVTRKSDEDGYYYFRLIGCGDGSGQCDQDVATSEWLFDELEFFQPRADSLYLVNETAQRGIHCRFGMAGVTAENHFDGSRNSIVMLSGARRYVLSHPDQCEKLALFPREHPSARHSSLKWDAATYYEHQKAHEGEYFPEFQHARSNQVVLQPGDVL